MDCRVSPFYLENYLTFFRSFLQWTISEKYFLNAVFIDQTPPDGGFHFQSRSGLVDRADEESISPSFLISIFDVFVATEGIHLFEEKMKTALFGLLLLVKLLHAGKLSRTFEKSQKSETFRYRSTLFLQPRQPDRSSHLDPSPSSFQPHHRTCLHHHHLHDRTRTRANPRRQLQISLCPNAQSKFNPSGFGNLRAHGTKGCSGCTASRPLDPLQLYWAYLALLAVSARPISRVRLLPE